MNVVVGAALPEAFPHLRSDPSARDIPLEFPDNIVVQIESFFASTADPTDVTRWVNASSQLLTVATTLIGAFPID